MTDETKRQALPWFAFDVAGYIKDTLRLTTESHGAYLLLMLDYYATTEPCPDDDDILAAVAKLPVEVWREKHRKVILPFFKVRDGKWVHDRIEREMQEAMLKHSSTIARATAGGHARWAKEGKKEAAAAAKPPSRRTSTPKPASSSAPAQPQAEPAALPEQSLEGAHLHLHKEESLSVLDVTVEKENSGDNSPAPSPEPEGLGTPINHKFWPCPNHITMCKLDGADDETINTEVQKFVLYHLDKGSWSADWDASFGMWWQRWREHQAKQKQKAAPRIEVNAQGYTPTDAEWRSWLLRWKSDSFWPRAAGPDPSTGRCKAPAHLFEQMGVDPKTGLAVAKPKEPAT